MTDLLTAAEANDLAANEAVIERGIKTFYEVGVALADIRDRKLYRDGYATFEEYAQQRWQMSRPRAYQLIEAAAVVSTTVDAGMGAPANERQARELSRVPEADRADVWRETVERTDGRPTAAAVRETYEQRHVPAEPDLLAGDDWVEPAGDAVPGQTAVTDHAPVETVTPTVTAPKRRPLPVAFDDAVTELGRAADRLHRLTGDDRFPRNRDQAQHRMPELLAAVRTTTDVLAALDPSAAQASEEARRWWATSLHALGQTLAGLATSIEQEN